MKASELAIMTAMYQFKAGLQTWRVPMRLIIMSRAEYCKEDFGGDLEKSLSETCALFAQCKSEIIDWARNNMDWAEVANEAQVVKTDVPDMQELWMNPDETPEVVYILAE